MEGFLNFLKIINWKEIWPIVAPVFRLLETWWWVFLPFLFWNHLKFLYRWWRTEVWDATVPRAVFEIKIPRESLKPIKAMEQVFAGFHAIHDVPSWREIWIEGQYQLSFAMEIASFGGDIHFYMRIPKSFKKIFESSIYSQYPEAEITEAEDYAKKMPSDIPNKNWDLFGMELLNTKEEYYPIKTYAKFETERETKEEKRVDPLASLLEGLASLSPDEQTWVQIICKPIRTEKPWVAEGKKARDKMVGRKEKPTPKPIIHEAADILISGKVPEGAKEEKEVLPPEMKLTLGEKEIVQAIEEKISKHGFDCVVRFVYLAKKEVFLKSMLRIPYGFFKSVSSETLNGFRPSRIPKVKSVPFWFLDARRVYLRKRHLFRYYQHRWYPMFPRGGKTYILNTEELATLYHFPSRTVAPTPSVSRVEAKKSAPAALPIEDDVI